MLLDAGNINVRGSNIVSDELTQIQAKDNANIEELRTNTTVKLIVLLKTLVLCLRVVLVLV